MNGWAVPRANPRPGLGGEVIPQLPRTRTKRDTVRVRASVATGGGHNAGPTGDIDRGARRPRAPRASLPISEREFRRAILQEPLEDLEYAITLEESNGPAPRGEEDKGRVKRSGGETQGFHAPKHPPPEDQTGRQMRREKVLIRKSPSPGGEEGSRGIIEPKSKQEAHWSQQQEANNPRDGQELEDSPARRRREEKAKGAGPGVCRHDSKEEPLEDLGDLCSPCGGCAMTVTVEAYF